MLMPASKEFVSLCQTQIALIGDALQADSTAIYLADNWQDGVSLPDLVPIAVYPNPGGANTSPDAFLDDKPESSTSLETLPTVDTSNFEVQNTNLRALKPVNDRQLSLPASRGRESAEEQLIIPLLYEGAVIGILTSRRLKQPWQDTERHQWDRLAQTLTLACVLDQRGQWFENRLQHSHRTQVQQSQRFHELLHQIRSPLTALKTFGKLLLKRLDPDTGHANLTHNMLRESDRIQDLLQYFDSTLKATDHQLAISEGVPTLHLPPASEHLRGSQSTDAIESEIEDLQLLTHFGGHLQVIHCDLLAVLQPVLDSAETLFHNQHIELYLTAEQEAVWVVADPKAIVEIVDTLLENALKYAGHHARVWVQIGLQTTQADQHFYGVLVGDTGPGIPAMDQDQIFDRNYRGVQAKGGIPGTGLGLAIVKDLVRAMGGYIDLFSPIKTLPMYMNHSVHSTADERGTIFIVWLPSANELV